MPRTARNLQLEVEAAGKRTGNLAFASTGDRVGNTLASVNSLLFVRPKEL
jgi:hypothetical protein